MDQEKGWKIAVAPLGRDVRVAIARAEELNAELDAWRAGLDTATAPAMRPGTIDWMFAEYMRHASFKRLKPTVQDGYRRQAVLIGDLRTRNGGRVGAQQVGSISARAVDRLYELLKWWRPEGKPPLETPRLRQAEYGIDVSKRAWAIVQRQHPKMFPEGNPFVGLVKDRPAERRTKRPASRAEAYALAEALRAAGHPGLGAAALIAFEWLQRPENILSGAIRWADYEPGVAVRVEHWKTGKAVELALSAEGEPLYPEIEAYLAGVPRWGEAMVLAPGRATRADPDPVARPYAFRRAHGVIARVREAAELAGDLTLATCRHGGMTELGDAGLTEAEIMSLSAHSSVEAARLYVKRTQAQRLSAARKRLGARRRVEQTGQ